MAACDVCKKSSPLQGLARRLAIPEYRAVIGFWPWNEVRVCHGCREAHDRDFRERMALLVPDVLGNDEPVSQPVCLACAAVEGPWTNASKWVDATGRPARRARFVLCPEHADAVYADGIVVSTNLTSADRVTELMDELPTVAGDLLARVEGWRPEDGRGPAGAATFAANLARDAVVADAWRFWETPVPGLEAKAAWLGPVRKDYRLRYRLDLVRDLAGGRRETLTVLRTQGDRFARYLTMGEAGA